MNKNKGKIICIDFDGTCVTHEYPLVGKEVGADKVLRSLVDSGHKLILYTMRSGKTLEDAVEWFRVHGLELHGINKNPDQHKWTESPKVYGHLYIDDAALGVPLMHGGSARPYVDWERVDEWLDIMGYYGVEEVEPEPVP